MLNYCAKFVSMLNYCATLMPMLNYCATFVSMLNYCATLVSMLNVKVDTEEAARRKRRETERDRKFCSYGYKFEQYMSVGRPGTTPPTHTPVDENTEFCCIFRTRIGQLHVVFIVLLI